MVELSADIADQGLRFAEVENPGVRGQFTVDLDGEGIVVAVQRLALAGERREVRSGETQSLLLEDDAEGHSRPRIPGEGLRRQWRKVRCRFALYTLCQFQIGKSVGKGLERPGAAADVVSSWTSESAVRARTEPTAGRARSNLRERLDSAPSWPVLHSNQASDWPWWLQRQWQKTLMERGGACLPPYVNYRVDR